MKKYRRKTQETIVEAVLFDDPEKLPKGVTPHPNNVGKWAYQSALVGGNTCELRLGQYLIFTPGDTCVAWNKGEFEAHYDEVGVKPKAPKKDPKPKPVKMSRPGGLDEIPQSK